MFPITDPGRAGDIRMRRRRAAWLLAGIVLVPLILFSGHDKGVASRSASGDGAQDLHIDLHALSIRSGTVPGTEIESVLRRIPLVGRLDWMVQGAPLPAGARDAGSLSATGASLNISLPCANSIALVPQSDLADRVFVSLLDGRPAGEAGVHLTGGTEIGLSGSCREGGADLVIQAPASMPLTLALLGGTALRLGRFSGPVRLTERGGGDVVIDASGRLDVEKAGSGDLSVGELDGTFHLVQAGAGDVTINRAEAAEVDVSMSGSGDLTIPAGHIGHLAAILRGSGDLSVAAEIVDATVQAGKDSDISLPHVTGNLDRRVSGDADD